MQRIIACSMNGRVVIRFFLSLFCKFIFNASHDMCEFKIVLLSIHSQAKPQNIRTRVHTHTHTRKCVPISHSLFVVVVLDFHQTEQRQKCIVI